jgi:hypothetical protein
MRHEKTITADEMQEIVQDIIDRLLYLGTDKLSSYKVALQGIKQAYPIDVQIINGVRVYGKIKHHENI